MESTPVVVKTKPFAMAFTHVIQDNTLTNRARFVYTLLASFCHNRRRTCYPTIDLLAVHSKMSPRQLQRYIKELEVKGVIERYQAERGRNLMTRLLDREEVRQN